MYSAHRPTTIKLQKKFCNIRSTHRTLIFLDVKWYNVLFYQTLYTTIKSDKKEQGEMRGSKISARELEPKMANTLRPQEPILHEKSKSTARKE